MWNGWHPDVPLVTLHARRRSLTQPIVDYLRRLETQDRHRRLVVLIPEVRPARPWQRILHNRRGVVLDRAIRRGTQTCHLPPQIQPEHLGGPPREARCRKSQQSTD